MAGAAPHPSGKGGKKALDAELNLVPFIDLLSCCISFLLITAVWTQVSGIQVSGSGGPQQEQKTETVDLKLMLQEKGYALQMTGGAVEIPKVASKDGTLTYDRRALAEKLHALKASLPDQNNITVAPLDNVAYDDLVGAVDTCVGEKLSNVTVAPAD